MFDELNRSNTLLGSELLIQLKVELSKRRQKPLVSLLKFLQNPATLNEDKDSFFAMSSKKDIFALASELWIKYFNGPVCESQGSAEPTQNSTEYLSAEARLGNAIGKRTQLSTPPTASNQSQEKMIKLACSNYASTNVLHPCLQRMYEALLLIKPTSIKNEQNFSMSSNILSRNRKKMSITTLDDLCFLKSHFISKQK